MGNARKTCSSSFVEEWKSRWEPETEALAFNGATCDPTRVDPKVVDWVKENCKPDVPHFVKIINANAAHNKPGLLLRNSSSLTVPSPFVRQHFRKLGRVVTLENEAGTRKWRVSFGAPKRDPQWLQGWDRVAAGNNFLPDHVVVFVLLENSHFRFTHFDSHGIKLDSTSTTTVHSPLQQHRCSSQESHDTTVSKTLKRKRPLESAIAPISQADDEEVQPVPEAAAAAAAERRRRNSNSTTSKDDDKNNNNNGGLGRSVMLEADPMLLQMPAMVMSKRRATTVAEHQVAKDAAMAHALSLTTTTTPHFVVVMTDSHVYHDFHLVVPESFVTSSGLAMTEETQWVLEDGGGSGSGSGRQESWEMLVKRNKYKEVAFHRKLWAHFALQHLLEEGDVCVFHLKPAGCNQSPTPLSSCTPFACCPFTSSSKCVAFDSYFEFRMFSQSKATHLLPVISHFATSATDPAIHSKRKYRPVELDRY